MAIENILRQLEDVLARIPERRHLDVDAIQSVIKVGSEAALSHQRSQRWIRGNNNSRVDAPRAVATNTLDGKILDCAQQLRLCRRGRMIS